MLRSIIVLLFLFSSASHAQTFLGLGAGVRLIKTDDSNYKSKLTPQVYGGYKIPPWAFALEGLYFAEKTSAGTSNKMENDHYEASIYALRFINYEDGRAINPYVVGGLGLFQERLTVNFMGTEDSDKSKLNSALKVGVGGWAQLGTMAFMNVEVKAMYSSDFTPDLVFDLSSRVGVEF